MWMDEGRAERAGGELGWLLANIAAMNPHIKKSRFSPSSFNPYTRATKPAVVTDDVKVLLKLFKVKPNGRSNG